MLIDAFRRFRAPQPGGGRIAEIGWFVDAPQSGFIWSAPERVGREEATARHAKSVAKCPAVIDHEARLYAVPSPVDLHLRFVVDEKTKEAKLSCPAGDRSSLRTNHIGKLLSLVSRKEWRHAERPVLQLMTPYHFIADEPVYMTQLPAFNHFRKAALPGLMIGGRLPIHIWVRPMMWAFEWWDTAQDLILRRGEPLFYLRFETEDPSRAIRLVEAELTPELREYMAGARAVTNYVSRTFSLFSVAKERRPQRLLIAKRR